GLGHRKGAFLEAFIQRFPFQVLHDQVARTAELTDIEQRADVRVVKTGDRSRLSGKSPLKIRPIAELRGKDLNRDDSIQACVPAPEHLSHAPGANTRQDLIRPQAIAALEGHDRAIISEMLSSDSGRRNG